MCQTKLWFDIAANLFAVGMSFLAIRHIQSKFAHYYIANGKWRFRRIYMHCNKPVFEQAKPVLITAASLICMILNLVITNIKQNIILLESGHNSYLRMAILK